MGRVFLGVTEGVVSEEDPTPESVGEHFPRIRSTEQFRTPHSVGASMAFSLARPGAGGAEPLALDLTTPAARQ
ncbi:hypothetical protein ACH4XT_39965 [Streptomyces avidinii]|uniref:hypothetical protein n=1 Tax=Streptomyces avidinii TaxID=1895 RepID=UPI00378BD227